MPTTSNFGWTTPADTNLVKDGAAAIRTLGNGIDTSFVDLKGGTTGQVLSKASNTDLDFTWATDASGIPATIFDAKGDLIAASAADTAARLAVGANGTVLTADSAETTGVKWATPSTPAQSFTSIATGSLPAAASLTISGISGKNDLILIINGWSGTTSTPSIDVTINATSTNYATAGQYFPTASSSPYAMLGRNWSYTNTSNLSGGSLDATGSTGSLFLRISGCNGSGVKPFQLIGSAGSPSSANTETFNYGGFWNNSATVSSLVVTINAGNFDAGSYSLYGA